MFASKLCKRQCTQQGNQTFPIIQLFLEITKIRCTLIFFSPCVNEGYKNHFKKNYAITLCAFDIFTLLMPQLICTPCTLCTRSDRAFVYEKKLVNNYYTRNLTFNCCQNHLKPTIAIHLLWRDR